MYPGTDNSMHTNVLTRKLSFSFEIRVNKKLQFWRELDNFRVTLPYLNLAKSPKTSYIQIIKA